MDTIKSDICKAAYELCNMLDEYFQKYDQDEFIENVLSAIQNNEPYIISDLLEEVEVEENYAE